MLGTNAVMGVLPGGTGNNFAKELGTSLELRPAVELLCTSDRDRHVDVVESGDSVFILRSYAGIEPEQQTTREDKDRFGKLAYLIDGFADRVLNLDTENAKQYLQQGREMTIDATPHQAVWADGEYMGRTPIELKVLPRALPVIIP